MPATIPNEQRHRLHPICHPMSPAQVVYVQRPIRSSLRIECSSCGLPVCEVGILSWMVEPNGPPELALVQPSQDDTPEVRGILRRENGNPS